MGVEAVALPFKVSAERFVPLLSERAVKSLSIIVILYTSQCAGKNSQRGMKPALSSLLTIHTNINIG